MRPRNCLHLFVVCAAILVSIALALLVFGGVR